MVIGSVMSEDLPITNIVAARATSGAQKTDAPAPSGFAGAWEAIEPGIRPSRVLIQMADHSSVTVLYTWGNGSQDGTWLRARARLLPDGKLYCRYPGPFIFALSPDGQTLIGERKDGGWKAPATYRKASKT